MSKIQCKYCEHASLAFDNFMDLSLPIPKTIHNGVTLQDCFESFTADEFMEKCGYKCAKCKKEDSCRK